MRRLFAAVLTAVVFAFLPAGARCAASDVPLRVAVDGKRMNEREPEGFERGGTPYVNVVAAVKSIGGLLVLAKFDEVRVTFAHRTVSFYVGHPTALLDDMPIRLPGAPFEYNGDTFVPLATLATLASARLTLDLRGHRAWLATGSGDGFPLVGTHGDEAGDVAPTPTQALSFVTSATTDETGLHARVDITNRTGKPYTIVFPRARQILFIVTRNGTEAWHSGSGATGTKPTALTIAPHETKTVSENWVGFTNLGPGRYTLRVRLATLIPIDISPISLGVSVSRTGQ